MTTVNPSIVRTSVDHGGPTDPEKGEDYDLEGLGLRIGGETGLVRVEPSGQVTLVTGSHSHGQGHETSFAQVISDALNVPMQQVRVIHGDTAAIERGVGTFASRSMTLGGSAAVSAESSAASWV